VHAAEQTITSNLIKRQERKPYDLKPYDKQIMKNVYVKRQEMLTIHSRNEFGRIHAFKIENNLRGDATVTVPPLTIREEINEIPKSLASKIAKEFCGEESTKIC
jgi:hypothetical protein